MMKHISQSGFTLMELVIYLGLLGIFLAFTIPTGLTIYQHTQQHVIQKTFESAIHHARLQALTKGSVWVLAPCHESKDWNLGIGLYSLDAFQQKPRQNPSYQWHWPTKQTQVTWHGFQSQEALYFMPDIGHQAVNGRFLIKVADQPTIKLVVTRLGYVHE